MHTALFPASFSPAADSLLLCSDQYYRMVSSAVSVVTLTLSNRYRLTFYILQQHPQDDLHLQRVLNARTVWLDPTLTRFFSHSRLYKIVVTLLYGPDLTSLASR